MIVYIVVIVAVLLLLLVAYRTLGGAQAGGVDNGAAVRRAAAALADAASSLDAAAQQPLTLSSPAPGGGLRALRSDIDGAAQLLEQADAAELQEAEVDAAALLRTAVVELRWAARLLDSGPTAETAGLQRAVSELLDHGRRCVASAQRLLRESVPLAEEDHGAAEALVE